MSWVAEASAITQNSASVSLKKPGNGTASATNPSPAATRNCISTTHRRFVPVISTSGLHSGLTTHGRYSQLV